MATFYSNNYGGRQLRLEVWQDGGYLKWTLYSEGGSADFYTIYNLSISIAGQNVYSPGTVNWSSKVFPAAKGSTGGSVWLGHSAGYREYYVSFIGAVYNNKSTQNGGNVGMVATISKPSLSGLSISNVSDTSAKISFSVTNSNNGNVSDSYIDIFKDSALTSKVATIGSASGTFTGLDPNRTYWARGNAANEAGRSYTGVKSFTTGFTNPGAPSNLKIECSNDEPIINAQYTLKWTAGSAGSKPISGYRLRIYKNDAEYLMVDTESTDTEYVFDMSTSDFQVGDEFKFGLYSYSKDWNNGKHFNGGGAPTSQVLSGKIIIVSDKYIYISLNGDAFDKRKMYISINGDSFKEVKKEKFKIIQ